MAERELKKFEFYQTRYHEHQNSVKWARERITKVKEEINSVFKIVKQGVSPIDFQFLIEIAELVYIARRAISFCSVKRFTLKGKPKQEFFDFMQKDLERSLELGTDGIEKQWINKCVDEENKALNSYFPVFKQNMVSLRDALERHFSTCVKSIKNNLQEVGQTEK